MKITFPVGVPAPGAVALTTAVNVIAWPDVDGLSDELSVVVVAAWLTVWASAVELAKAKAASPPYLAVMVWDPTLSPVLVNVATPLAFSVPVPSVVLPSKKVTVPVGVAVAGATALTVAVKRTGWPKTEGLTDEFRTTVAALWTVCVRPKEVLVMKFVSPP